YADTQYNRAKGVWIHVAPTITKDIKQWFEAAGWTKPEDWPEVGRTILNFVKRCLHDRNALADHCRWFAETVPSKGFQMGMLTPILNALAPESFNIINNKPRQALNYFLDANYTNAL